MKIYPPFSGALAAFGAAYFTAVLCGVCGIREWGALIVTVAVGGLTCGVVNSLDGTAPRGPFTALRKRAWGHVPISRDEVLPLPEIDQDPLAIEINRAARDLEKQEYEAEAQRYLDEVYGQIREAYAAMQQNRDDFYPVPEFPSINSLLQLPHQPHRDVYELALMRERVIENNIRVIKESNEKRKRNDLEPPL